MVYSDIPFAKYHGCGNNFVIVREADLAGIAEAEIAEPAGSAGTGFAGGAGSAGESSGAGIAEAGIAGGAGIVESEPAGIAGIAEAGSAGAAIAAVSEPAGFAGGAKEPLPLQPDESAYVRFAQNICDPNTGIGADGLIIVREAPALEMVFFNCDGSRAPMCGNGIRCFAHFCLDEGIRGEASYPVKTLAGDMVVNVVSREPFAARIDMGRPIFAPEAVGVDSEASDLMDFSVALADGSQQAASSLFMGTVHTVVFVEDLAAADIAGLGREICEHPVYREKTNVNFVQILDDAALEMRTYERGVGPTLACGTGACASVVAANLKGLCGRRAEVRLALGALVIQLMEDGHVFMEGPSVKICDGVLGGGYVIPAAGGKER